MRVYIEAQGWTKDFAFDTMDTVEGELQIWTFGTVSESVPLKDITYMYVR